MQIINLTNQLKYFSVCLLGILALVFLLPYQVSAAVVGDQCVDDTDCTGFICVAENETDEFGACIKCDDNNPDFACFDGEVCSPAGKCVNQLTTRDDDTLQEQNTGEASLGELCGKDTPCASGLKCSDSSGNLSGTCVLDSSSSSDSGEPLGALCDDKKKCKSGLVCSDPKSGTCVLGSSTTGNNSTSSGDGKIPGATSYDGQSINIFGIIKGNNLGEAIVSIYTDAAVPLLGIVLFIHIVYGLISQGILWSGSSDKAIGFLVGEFKNGALAYIILLSAYIVLNTINPDLVDGGFDVQAVQNQAGSALGGGSGNQGGGGGTGGQNNDGGGTFDPSGKWYITYYDVISQNRFKDGEGGERNVEGINLSRAFLNDVSIQGTGVLSDGKTLIHCKSNCQNGGSNATFELFRGKSCIDTAANGKCIYPFEHAAINTMKFGDTITVDAFSGKNVTGADKLLAVVKGGKSYSSNFSIGKTVTVADRGAESHFGKCPNNIIRHFDHFVGDRCLVANRWRGCIQSSGKLDQQLSGYGAKAYNFDVKVSSAPCSK